MGMATGTPHCHKSLNNSLQQREDKCIITDLFLHFDIHCSWIGFKAKQFHIYLKNISMNAISIIFKMQVFQDLLLTSVVLNTTPINISLIKQAVMQIRK
jgi:hypothetical protein